MRIGRCARTSTGPARLVASAELGMDQRSLIHRSRFTGRHAHARRGPAIGDGSTSVPRRSMASASVAMPPLFGGEGVWTIRTRSFFGGLSAGTGRAGRERPCRAHLSRPIRASVRRGRRRPGVLAALDGQVFWLSAHDGFGRPSRPRMSGIVALWSEASPITAAAPRRIFTGFPILPPEHSRPGAPVERAPG